jgi:hypothetical protein
LRLNSRRCCFDNGQIRLKTEAEKLEEEKQRKLAELKTYIGSLLGQTDYIIVKIAEAQVSLEIQTQ